MKIDSSIIQKSDQDIIKKIGMAELPLILYVLNQKYHGKYTLIDIGCDCMFRYGNTNVANVSYLATYIHLISFEDNCIKIIGNISWPSVIKEELHFYAKNNENSFDCELHTGVFNRYTDSGDLFEKRDVFEVKIPLTTGLNEIYFIYECNGIHSPSGKINAMRHSPVSDILPKQYAEVDGWLLKIVGGKLCIEKNDSLGESAKILEKIFSSSIKDEKIKKIREKYFIRLKNKKKPIWLFMDRLEKADDNGEAFFKYVVNHEGLNVDSFFIISEDSPDYERLKAYGNVVPAMSEEHILLLFLADFIFTSQLNGWVENPFPTKEEYFRDLYHHAKVVFLQHGVTKDDHSKWLNQIKQNLFAIVTSSEKEAKDMEREEYGYKKEQIWNVGMPRFDLLSKEERRYVLVLPTWRRGMMSQKYVEKSKTYRWVMNDKEKNNNYFNIYNSLLSNKKLKTICEKNGYKLAFLAHPLMQDYLELFNIPKDVVIIPYTSRWRDVFAQSALMITDYSSAAFDFAYVGRPIIYYHFDEDTFFKNHTYQKGYFDYEEMGFGDVVRNEKSLLSCLNKIQKNHFEVEEKYKERVNKFFTKIDNHNMDRLLDKIKQL